MNDDIIEGIASAVAFILIIGVVTLAFVKPDSAIALCLLAIAVFKGAEKI